MKSVAVIGVGKLGLPMMAAMASRGFEVTGYDIDEAKIRKIQKGRLPYEPGLKRLFRKHRRRLKFTRHLGDVSESSILFVVVPTPSELNGAFSVRYLKKVLGGVGRLLKKGTAFQVVAVVSTVLPGDMERLRIPLEKNSKKRCGRDFGFCYNPAFIALGNVVQNFLRPDFVLIGESDPRSGGRLESFHKRLCGRNVKIHRTNFTNAELAKISLNTYITMKISFANTLARLCERIPRADTDVITGILGSDHRIGSPYLKGALGYGGPCFPRDNQAFAWTAKRRGLRAFLAEATDRVNRTQILWLKKLVLRLAGPGETIGIFGLSYKPDTDVTEESQGLALAKALAKSGRPLVLYDPVSGVLVRKIFKSRKVFFAENLSQAFRRSDVIVIATAWKSFRQLKSVELHSRSRYPKRIIDPWRVLERHSLPQGVVYVPLGVGQQ
jgi:UDPglucose 6-dehydrogenase